MEVTDFSHHRRVCPGVHLAEKSLYIVVTRTLWGFNITKKIGRDGSVIEPNQVMMPGFLSVPEMFECDITCRSQQHEKLIRKSYEAAMKEGLKYRN
jgi:hypothetical protein